MCFGVGVKSLSIFTFRREPAGMECSFSFFWLLQPHNQQEVQCPWPVEEQRGYCSKKTLSRCDGQGPKLHEGEVP